MDESPSTERKFRNSPADWIVRAAIFVAFLFWGASKFKSDANAPWVVLFNQVGFGRWFRYFTGGMETLSAFLVLVPQTVTAGLAMLLTVLTGAILIDVMVLRRPADAFVPFAILCALIALWMHRRRV